MGLEYVNRRGQRYYILQGKTKTGKPKYYASKKPTGVLVDQLPEGFEVCENPEQGLVSVRKIRPTSVLPLEREALTRWTRELAGVEYFIVDVQGDSLVVYTPSHGPGALTALSEMFGSFPGVLAATSKLIADQATYVPMMRFTLVNEQKRLYSLERWCFRGAIDGWFPLSAGPLETLARKYLPHLNQESFFELM